MAYVTKAPRLFLWVSLVVAGSASGGCVSASLEDAAPTEAQVTATEEAAAQTSADPRSDSSFVQEGALRNDAFPTFENTPVAATEQLSSADKARLEAEMDSVRTAYGTGALSEADYIARMKELQTLARTHGREVDAQLRQ